MSEDDYSKQHHGYDADEARDLVDLALEFVLVALAIAAMTFVIFSALGFIWGKS